MLVLANVFWGISFPLIKAVALEHQRLLPGSNSWYVSACMLAPRFFLAAAIMGLFWRGRLRAITGRELRQGLGLAAFAVLGMFFQNDGLQYTAASTSAFLTQLYVVIIPAWFAIRRRHLPPLAVWLACALVLAGTGTLAQLDWHRLNLGRGEIETLISSLFFAGQIMLLSRPGYSANRPLPVTFVMFLAEGAVSLIMIASLKPGLGALGTLGTSAPWWAFTMGLTLFCTLGAFTLMNTWQPRITATEAGLIYCLEPVFASLLALCLPGLLSRWAGFDYANESLTISLLTGGGLITAANVLIQVKPMQKD